MDTASAPQDESSHGGRLTQAARRVLVTVAGILIVVAGVAMLFLPGPGILSILGGLALLGTEYTWAKRSAAWLRHRFSDAVHLHHDDESPQEQAAQDQTQEQA